MSQDSGGNSPDNDWRNKPESRVKHLEIIQAVIARMANNSFMIKSWCITMVAALLALAGGKDVNNVKLVYVAYIPLLMFWYLDGYFLQQERTFRGIYDHFRKQSEADFTISSKDLVTQFQTDSILKMMWSKTLRPFYGVIFICVVAAHIFLNNWAYTRCRQLTAFAGLIIALALLAEGIAGRLEIKLTNLTGSLKNRSPKLKRLLEVVLERPKQQ